MDASETLTRRRSASRKLAKVFGEPPREVTALQNIDLDIYENEFVTLVGASGCGKSTLLRIIGGLDYNTGGEINVRGKPVQGRAPIVQWCSSITASIRGCG